MRGKRRKRKEEEEEEGMDRKEGEGEEEEKKQGMEGEAGGRRQDKASKNDYSDFCRPSANHKPLKGTLQVMR